MTTPALVPVFTDAGLAAIAAAHGQGLAAKITSLVLGDGNGAGYSPSAAATGLVHERLRLAVAAGGAVGPRQVLVTAVAPAEAPEFWVREVGFVLETGELLALWSDPVVNLGWRSSLAPWVFKFSLSWTVVPPNSLAVMVNGEALQAATALGLAQTDGKVRHTVEHAGLAWAAADDTLLTQALGRLGGTNVTLISASRAVTVAEAGLVLLDATAGPVTVTLPLAAALAGLRYDLVRVDATAHAVTIQRAGSDGVDGGASVTLTGQYALRALRSGGVAAWYTVAGIPATTDRAGALRLATAAEIQSGADVAAALTPSGLMGVQPSTAQRALMRTATAAEVQAGTEAAAALTPAALAAVLPAPAAGGRRVLGVTIIGSTGDTATTSQSFVASSVVGQVTRSKAGSTLYVLALIDGQVVGGAATEGAYWQVEQYTGGAWVSAGITSIMSLLVANSAIRSGLAVAGILNNTSVAAIDLRLAHRAGAAGATVTTGAASTLLVFELG